MMGNDKLTQLRGHYDNTDMSEALQGATRDGRTIDADEVMVSTSIRLPRSLMQRVREHADQAGVPATTLMRQWVLDRLDLRDDDVVVSVADLERLIAERGHSVAS